MTTTSEQVTVPPQATTSEQAAPSGAVLPPGPRLPRLVQGVLAVTSRRRALQVLRRRYGSAFTLNLPFVGRAVVLSDPDEVREMFRLGPELADNLEYNLGRVLGPNSMFALTDERHRRHRRMLVPPFHGRRLGAYEDLIEELTREELATWPSGIEFPTLPAMMRITLNVILRAVFGAEGDELEQLRRLLPRMVVLGSRLAMAPLPDWELGGHGPWARFHRYRRQYDAIVDSLIAAAHADPRLDERNDVLALMLQSRYEDGSSLSRDEVADQLVTLLSAGHETTATTLAWAVERLRRHPRLLERLTAELDAGDTQLLDAVITETQRSRPVIDVTDRAVRAERLTVGRWTLTRGQLLVAAISLVHDDETLFPHPERFDPDRFVGTGRETYTGIPFGGGARRCIGAAFAQLEMKVVLRTLLTELALEPTDAPGERWHSRGVTFSPAQGGRVIVNRRNHQTA